MKTMSLVYGVCATGLIIFFVSIALFEHWSDISPTAPNPATGQICSLNNHGYIFYVTRSQSAVYHTLLLGGFGLSAIGVGIGLWLERRQRRRLRMISSH